MLINKKPDGPELYRPEPMQGVDEAAKARAEAQGVEGAVAELNKRQRGAVGQAAALGSISNIQVRKNLGGYFQLFHRGTNNEVFPNKRFASMNEARSYWKAQKAKEDATTPAERYSVQMPVRQPKTGLTPDELKQKVEEHFPGSRVTVTGYEHELTPEVDPATGRPQRTDVASRGNARRAVVTLPSGKTLVVAYENDIVVDETALRAAYGDEWVDSAKEVNDGKLPGPIGSVSYRFYDNTRLDGFAMIRLVAGKADDTTLKHERLHVARMTGLFSDPEWDALAEKYGKPAAEKEGENWDALDPLRQEEMIADGVEGWSPPKRNEFWRDVKDAVRGLFRATVPNADDVLARIDSGEVFGRKGKVEGSSNRYASDYTDEVMERLRTRLEEAQKQKQTAKKFSGKWNRADYQIKIIGKELARGDAERARDAVDQIRQIASMATPVGEVEFGSFSQQLSDIAKAQGVDIPIGTTHVVTGEKLAHVRRAHPDMTIEDLGSIPAIVDSPDHFGVTRNSQGYTRLWFLKQNGGDTLYLAVYGAQKGKIRLETFYKEKRDVVLGDLRSKGVPLETVATSVEQPINTGAGGPIPSRSSTTPSIDNTTPEAGGATRYQMRLGKSSFDKAYSDYTAGKRNTAGGRAGLANAGVTDPQRGMVAHIRSYMEPPTPETFQEWDTIANESLRANRDGMIQEITGIGDGTIAPSDPRQLPIYMRAGVIWCAQPGTTIRAVHGKWVLYAARINDVNNRRLSLFILFILFILTGGRKWQGFE